MGTTMRRTWSSRMCEMGLLSRTNSPKNCSITHNITMNTSLKNGMMPGGVVKDTVAA